MPALPPGMPQLTQEQQAAIRAMNQASAPMDQAVTEARTALDAAIFTDNPDPADVKAKAEHLAPAELARALARAEAFAKLQASPNKLTLARPALMMLMNRSARGGPGGFGSPGFPGGPGGPGFPGGPGGPDGPGGNGPPSMEASSEVPFVSPIFGDNMVLQRGKPNTMWGWAKPGEEIRVTIAENTVKTVTKDDGRWSVVIEPPAPGGPYAIVIDGPQHVELRDVLVGDVWLCGGQSNMEMGLGAAQNGSEEVKAADHPRIRMFVVGQQTARTPAKVPRGSWKICSPQSIGEGWNGFSAVAYFFGRKLQRDLDVPIGLVKDCSGGTPAEAWTSAETLRSLGINDTGSGPSTPAVLYNGMIAPVAPLAISGVIWYQGESNADRAAQYPKRLAEMILQYRKLLAAMITDWRRAFGQGDFPFYIVSLAAHQQHKDTPGDDAWAELRAGQDFVANTVTNSGLAVAIDVGDARDVHPKDKKEVGERLGFIALARHYGKNIPYSGPRFASAEKTSGALKLLFTHTDGGLAVKGDKLEEFSICGEDCKWHWADAKVVGDTVVVSASEVPNPVAARYAWQANPQATLFNGAGLPAIPFRTDDLDHTNDNKKLEGKK
jgi:sialate O-acetylesterase